MSRLNQSSSSRGKRFLKAANSGRSSGGTSASNNNDSGAESVTSSQFDALVESLSPSSRLKSRKRVQQSPSAASSSQFDALVESLSPTHGKRQVASNSPRNQMSTAFASPSPRKKSRRESLTRMLDNVAYAPSMSPVGSLASTAARRRRDISPASAAPSPADSWVSAYTTSPSSRSKMQSGRRLFGMPTSALSHSTFSHSQTATLDANFDDGALRPNLKARQQRLNEKIDALLSEQPRLLLPQSYQLLLSMFRALENVMSVYRGRSVSTVTYENVKNAVGRLVDSHRTFERLHLGQIVSVFPQAYDVKIVRLKDDNGHVKFQHQICWKSVDGSVDSSGAKTVKESALKSRYEVFEKRLYDKVHEQHDAFLRENSLPLFDRQTMRTWHSQFPLDECQPIPASLPPIPTEQRTKSHEAINKLIQQQKEQTKARAKQLSSVSPPKRSLSSSSSSSSSTSLSGVSSSLLARVRQRSTEQQVDQRSRGPEQRARIRMVQGLTRLVGILHSIFTSSRRQALPLSEVVKNVIRSGGPSKDTLMEQLSILCEVVPDWCSRFNVGRGTAAMEFLKLSKTVGIHEVKRKVVQYQQELIDQLDSSGARSLVAISHATTTSSPSPSITSDMSRKS